jgi:hypothetical protein
LKPGLAVELLDGNGSLITSNPITFIAPRADDGTQTVLVKSQIRQLPPNLRVLQYVRARIVWSEDLSLTVPIVAVNRISGQYFVFVAEPSEAVGTSGAGTGQGGGEVARQKPIKVGEVVGDEYLVESGLKAGERVIVSNLQKLGDGVPVKAS